MYWRRAPFKRKIAPWTTVYKKKSFCGSRVRDPCSEYNEDYNKMNELNMSKPRPGKTSKQLLWEGGKL
jgi:hypothetical protein